MDESKVTASTVAWPRLAERLRWMTGLNVVSASCSSKLWSRIFASPRTDHAQTAAAFAERLARSFGFDGTRDVLLTAPATPEGIGAIEVVVRVWARDTGRGLDLVLACGGDEERDFTPPPLETAFAPVETRSPRAAEDERQAHRNSLDRLRVTAEQMSRPDLDALEQIGRSMIESRAREEQSRLSASDRRYR